MLFFAVTDKTSPFPSTETSLSAKNINVNVEGMHSEIHAEKSSRVLTYKSTVLAYDCFFQDQILEGISTDENMLSSLLDDRIRYFILLEPKKKTVTIAKSLSAAKTLYYFADQKKREICISTRISLLRDHGVPIRENKNVIPEFFVSRFVVPPNTMYENIFQVAAGQKLKAIFGESSIEIVTCTSYVPPKVNGKYESSHEGHYSAKLIEQLTEGLSKIFEHDNNTSLISSGGLDSSLLAKVGINLGRVQKTFSTSYPFLDSDKDIEKRYALTAADALGISQEHFETTTAEFLESIIRCIAINEAPIQWPQTAMLYLLFSKCIPRKTQIIISGYGADGISGSSVYVLNMLIPLIKILSPLKLSRICVNILSLLKKEGAIISKSLRKDFDNPCNAIWHYTSYGDMQWVCKTFGVSEKEIIKERLNTIQELTDRSLFDIIGFLDWVEGTETQAAWNKLAESTGRQLFFPFLSKKTIDFFFGIPWSLKLRKPKYIIRCAARKVEVPKFIITRRKSGFGLEPYVNLWATPKGIFAPLLTICKEYFSDDEIRELQMANQSRAATLWSMIVYSIWRKIMIENISVSELIQLLNDSRRVSDNA
jgi:asparagine synthetase B (glutamine-hydrolysing)